ncbi:type VII secretion AAA-ATPase EccA [Mycolicibacterium goodii]|uniref:type VII secretion AAA-ATPase EccA n=1 Tax=Mycolicibacterium goodii TaxID=134601 RepID=UPI001BDD3417|nr:type VII secretion AAA-ATPase EccA [Mycolicibacterium goodii]MBU8819267.1 type VII secretion AAA-ATPase EccA [Mycolicibacterium goodii]
MTERAKEALKAGVAALPGSPRKALRVFGIALEDDPTMADAWLGRVAAGDRSIETLQALSDSSRNLGHHLRSIGKSPAQLRAQFHVDNLLTIVIDDDITARLAYISALIDGGDYDRANALLGSLPARADVACIRAVLMSRTERWPDVLTAISGCEAWLSAGWRRAASVLEATAAANLGLLDRAATAADRANTVPDNGAFDSMHCTAQFILALLARMRGEEDKARELLADVRARWPEFELAKTALSDETYAFKVVDHAAIESRTNPWDPRTQRTAEMDYADQQQRLLAEAEAELDSQIGLADVKQQVRKLKSSTKLNRIRVARGFAPIVGTNHLVFTGPPGTGKTTIARVVARIYCGLGILATPKVLEVSRADLVAEFEGQSAPKTNAKINEALDGALFIDEAYTLVQERDGRPDPFGTEALNTLLARMENDRDRLVVIIAGYEQEIDRLLDSNEGLRGRFPRRLRFPSYTAEELADIADTIVAGKDSTMLEAARNEILRVCQQLDQLDVVVDRRGEMREVVGKDGQPRTHLSGSDKRRRLLDVLGNGRFIRNVVEAAFEELGVRVGDEVDNLSEDEIDSQITTLNESDVNAALKAVLSSAMPVGFDAGSLF